MIRYVHMLETRYDMYCTFTISLRDNYDTICIWGLDLPTISIARRDQIGPTIRLS